MEKSESSVTLENKGPQIGKKKRFSTIIGAMKGRKSKCESNRILNLFHHNWFIYEMFFKMHLLK